MRQPDTDLAALRLLEPEAVDRFYRDHAGLVLGWVIRLGGARLDAEDVAHQVFEVALARLPGFRGESKVSTWLYGVTRRVVANARRKALLWSFVPLDLVLGADADDAGDSPETTSHREGQRRLVQRALDDLTFGLREIVVLVDLEERPAAEVAEMLGIPVGTVYSRVHHARRALAKALGRRGVTSDQVALLEGAP